ncbi:hypothetical protein FBZ94_10162 [Bradyrhizobium sacchari]|uniref:Uncharacterized protein n=1 Tax=Bradyrhizobium sacchari TaxID=1399419 RepID=A0A560JDA2_9BRAD|nr:hypothetical protein FBZ94_10162 [Bradyrhizobium sacchari]TWB83627.1 hypothetical protein FBZ95_10162 [Bradyrhizobium sacchari]
MVGMAEGSNRAVRGFWQVCLRKSGTESQRECVAERQRFDFLLPKREVYRLKNDVSVDPADAVSGLAGAGCGGGAGAGSSRFDERFEE